MEFVASISQGRKLLRSAACLHTNQSRSYLNHLVQYTAALACLIQYRLYKTSETVEVQLHTFLTSKLNGNKRSALGQCSFFPEERNHWHQKGGGAVGPNLDVDHEIMSHFLFEKSKPGSASPV